MGKILKIIQLANWNWVPTSSNVADEDTKWQHTHAPEPVPDGWFNSPSFLRHTEKNRLSFLTGSIFNSAERGRRDANTCCSHHTRDTLFHRCKATERLYQPQEWFSKFFSSREPSEDPSRRDRVRVGSLI